MTKDTHDDDPVCRQRLLEGWLPLAQEACLRFGWSLEAAALEALILAAAPALRGARSALEARSILWTVYARGAVGGRPQR